MNTEKSSLVGDHLIDLKAGTSAEAKNLVQDRTDHGIEERPQVMDWQ